jgi:hypothetical protein
MAGVNQYDTDPTIPAIDPHRRARPTNSPRAGFDVPKRRLVSVRLAALMRQFDYEKLPIERQQSAADAKAETKR